MRVVYDNVYGTSHSGGPPFSAAVTDALPNMLQVSRGTRDGRLCWRKVRGSKFGPFWLSKSDDGLYHWYESAFKSAFPRLVFFVGAPLTPKEATVVIKRYASTLPRTGGSILVQIYALGGGYYVALYHTTDRKAESVNPGRPKGFPARVKTVLKTCRNRQTSSRELCRRFRHLRPPPTRQDEASSCGSSSRPR